ncbi:50S ribosomal protein L22-like [Zingiber officinale]|uniref:Large ribosomal subunit protein uL22c n=1 Tax=Zingiber officinale TaxID=94328 RepID=A0A8J5LTE6_ZINOF|nr:50S ribosomal protein L22-like [Zingiber officinale]XP_042374301.1 50S ribosomal protein L22-like [Zingiber officinale]XP_042470940.1 50S ribosomal protein L22-like [Zingiber officinale]XP_042470941.1 50S ribosomal protein L22-like [Zingiber officinale]KAG6522705.1 hypothetical protein ZIOFF_019856 [Zingiber officinale]
MAGWQRCLRSVFRQVTTVAEQNCRIYSTGYSTCTKILSPGQYAHPWRLSDFSSAKVGRPLYQYLQHLQISSTRSLLAEENTDAVPISSPLLIGDSLKTKKKDGLSKPLTVQAIKKKIRQSPKKVNLVAKLVRGMRVEDALLQLQLIVKRAAMTVYQVIHSARANATHNHGLDPDRLLVAEAFVGKGVYRKQVSYHAKGRSGVMERPQCRLTVVVRETTPEEETKIAKLRVSNFKKLTKRERQLMPHKLIETTPKWTRRRKEAATDS